MADIAAPREHDPPRNGEGDHAKHGGGGFVQVAGPPPPHFVRSPSPFRGGMATGISPPPWLVGCRPQNPGSRTSHA